MSTKAELRSKIRGLKKAMTEEEIDLRSRKLGMLLSRATEYRLAETVYGYLPINQEVRLIPILEQAIRDGKRVAVPRIRDGEMVFVYLSDFSRIQPGPGGFPEPMDDGPAARDEGALVILPGLVFDNDGRRIGYGGGYYDRFLAREPNHPTIALCYDFQVMSHPLPTDPHDITAGKVLQA